MSKADYDLLAAEIETVKNAATPNMPISKMIEEAESLLQWCQEDKVRLTAVGLKWPLVEKLSVRIGALSYIQGEWNKESKSTSDAQRVWNLHAPVAYELRNGLIHDFLFAYFSSPDALANTQHIAEGTGNADMIQDLVDLGALGKANPAPLTAIGFNLALLDQAVDLAEEMNVFLGLANGTRLHANLSVQKRDRAYTYLKDAVDEIRRCGQYAFWRDENRKKGYVSLYQKKKSAKSKSKDIE
jgi:hypothetical protein